MSINSDYSFTEQLIHVSRLISAIRAYEVDAGPDSTGATEFLHDYAESLCVIIEQEQRKTPETYNPTADELARARQATDFQSCSETGRAA